MKSKYLIITISDYGNLGNRLQNYAVYSSLNPKRAVVGENNTWRRGQKYWFFRGIGFLSRNGLILKIIKEKRYREYLFYQFSSKTKRTNKHFEGNEQYYSSKYDLFLYGSDQIWNPEFAPENCIVPKTPKEKNVALCASIGADYIPNERLNEYKEGLSKFRKISVREEKAADIVEQLIGIRPEVLIDLTLSISKEQWIAVERIPYYNKKKWDNKRYIFIYFLGNLSAQREEKIKKLADRLNAEIVDATRGYISSYIGPAEFIWLIHHSLMVITDSYHGSIFSFIFDKSFYILDREDEEIKMSMNSRFDTLFRELDLFDRKNNNISEYTIKHNYTHSYYLLEQEKKKYFDFLNHVMEN